MPGSIVHLLIQRQMYPYLLDKEEKKYANLLKEDICSPYTGFGSIGPDFLFFSMREYGDAPAELINFYFKIYDTLEPFIEFYEKNVKPIEDAVEDAETWVDEKIFDGLLQELKGTVSTMINAALLAIPAEGSKKLDLFFGFYPKIQCGEPENNWYWFDFLHYRRTGEFCSNMWKIAQGDNDLMRYCLGYASHIGTDVVGHPYVNAIVGGPYRTHWHRHKLVENWIDAYTRRKYGESMGQYYEKCLNIQEEDKYDYRSISGSYLSRLCEFKQKKLPRKLGNMIVEALDRTYNDIPHPRKLNFDDLDTTYRLWLSWFEKATSIGIAVKPEPVEPPWEIFNDLLEDYLEGVPTLPGKAGNDSFNINNLFKSIHDFLKHLAEVIHYTVDWLIEHLVDIITLGYRVGLRGLKYILYLIHKGVYEFYDNYRFVMVLGGYIFPEAEDLEKHPWGQALLNTSFVNLTGGGTANYSNYPLRQEYHNWDTPEHHLKYPETFQENPYTEPAPIPFFNQYPEIFISTLDKYKDGIEALYDCVAPYGDGMEFTHYVDSKTWETAQLGNASLFSADLIAQRMENLPNFNLDGDRGYAWKTWRANNPEQINNLNTVDVTYIDRNEE
ncbi:hypothetical protein [Bacillus mycoides]|uniref:hypothetical protein n=1 Tax=Bacillus mycoides TaxID=1405 RepID=UPI003F8D1E9E